MTTRFWIRRFLTAFAGAFVLLAGVAALRGHATRDALAHGLMWGSISALLFTGSHIQGARRGRRCAWCAGAPESGTRS